MKWIAMPALLAGFVALGQQAEAQSLTGCWNYSDGTVFSTVCFDGDGGGTFNLEYAAEDPEQGIVKGSCNGYVEVESMDAGGVVFRVPYQEDACRQEDQVFRVARRDYSCSMQDHRLLCDLVVYYDNGAVYSEASGLEYTR